MAAKIAVLNKEFKNIQHFREDQVITVLKTVFTSTEGRMRKIEADQTSIKFFIEQMRKGNYVNQRTVVNALKKVFGVDKDNFVRLNLKDYNSFRRVIDNMNIIYDIL